MSNKKVLLLALICGLLAAVALNFYLQSVKEAATNIKTKKVAVATARIPARTLVTTDMVSFKNIPVEYVHGNAISDSSQVIGHTTRAEVDIGEQILQTKLVPKESTGTTLAYSVPLGLRAVSIPVNEWTGISGLLTPGDRVDVIGRYDVEIASPDPNVNTVKKPVSLVLVQNSEVLAIDQNYTDSSAQQGDKKNQTQGSNKTVTLAIPVDKVQDVVMVCDKGKIALALRSPADKSEEQRRFKDDLQLLK